jgi:signal transduction histidine kinase
MRLLSEYAITRRLSLMLVGAFALTVLSFLGSTVLASRSARGIGDAVESIVTNGAPSIQHVSGARSSARRWALALDDLVDAVAARAPTADLEAAQREARATFGREWATYKALPLYPGETKLWGPVDATRARVEAQTDEILATLRRGDAVAATAILNEHAKPDFNQLDNVLHEVVDFNARQVERLGSEIDATRRATRRLLGLLDVACACFAALAAVLIARTYANQARLMELRVSDLELFAGRVAHDVRSPLTSVALALEFAKRASAIDERTRTALERGARTIQRVGQLVDGLLLFARAGAAPEAGARAEVRDVTAGVLEELRPTAEEKGIELSIDDHGASTVACSPGVLASIFSNLVGNAIKYMGDAPERRVSVRARDVGAHLRIEVEDTGPGVPPELRERIFDPYVRNAGSTVPGLGLGLATVRRLAKAHGGDAGMGDTKGSGSLFWVELLSRPVPGLSFGAAPKRSAALRA